MQQSIFKKVVITEIKEEVNNVKLFYLKEEGEKLSYKAGQYLTFILPQGETEIRRSYSLASSPDLNEPLCIGVKRIQNGAFSRHLFDRAKIGDILTTLGAGGVFVLPADIQNYEVMFFFAAGSGIVPIFSLLKSALFVYPHLRVILIYSNSSQATTILYEPLKRLAEEFPGRLTIEFIFSDAKNLSRAHLHADLIERFVKQHSGAAFAEDLYYICGPEAYMRLCTYTLRGMKVPADNIKKEIFHTKKSVQQVAPPDNAPHEVTLLRGDEVYKVVVQHPVSILMAARKEGIILPYSCEIGRCGNCIAKCESGKVWMSYNEVLTEKEIAQGFILTCTGYPIGGDATIRY